MFTSEDFVYFGKAPECDRSYDAEAKGVEVALLLKVDGFYDQASIIKTQKLTFRDMVRPDETIYTVIRDLSIS